MNFVGGNSGLTVCGRPHLVRPNALKGGGEFHLRIWNSASAASVASLRLYLSPSHVEFISVGVSVGVGVALCYLDDAIF